METPCRGLLNGGGSRSFEPTYKEWKLLIKEAGMVEDRLFWAYLQGMETNPGMSYLSHCFRFWAYLQGMETSNLHALAKSKPIVLSLPTRNGNSWKQSLLYRKGLFWAYLQGMETGAFFSLPRWALHVLSLPTRNGNVDILGDPWAKWRFWAYLQGMETFLRGYQNWCGHRGFWAYLQGMETRSHMNLYLSASPFWAYLQGMETTSFPHRMMLLFPVLSLPTRNGNGSQR